MKWLGVCALMMALAQAGKAVRLAFQTSPTQQIEIVKIFPGPIGSDNIFTWVLETASDSHPAPSHPALASLSIAESSRSVANRNSNPLNMKLGSETRRYVDIGLATISDIIPKDGGRFLKFNSPEAGFRAAIELLSTPRYDDPILDRALRRWSNNGFGAEILAGTRLDARKPVPYFGRDDFRVLLNAMAAAEGYKSSTIADEIKKALRAAASSVPVVFEPGAELSYGSTRTTPTRQ